MNDQRITARELRLGNYLLNIGLNEVFQVKTIDSDMEHLSLVAPIPLTEEWLLKFGFAYRNENRGEGAILDFKTDNWKTSLSVAFDMQRMAEI